MKRLSGITRPLFGSVFESELAARPGAIKDGDIGEDHVWLASLGMSAIVIDAKSRRCLISTARMWPAKFNLNILELSKGGEFT